MLQIPWYFLIAARADIRLVRGTRRGDEVLFTSRTGLDARAATESAVGVELFVRLAVRALGGASTGRHANKSRRGR
jgi:hypothetical protein